MPRPDLRLLTAAACLSACSAPVAPPAAAPQAVPIPAPAESRLPPEGFYVLPEIAGWNTAALDEALAYAQAQRSTGFIIIDRGRIITERYWPAPEGDAFFELFIHGTSADGALIEDVASLQKSIIALLAGIAIDKSLLDVEEPVSTYLGTGWSAASAEAEAAITIRHLMEMNSGLKEDLSYEAAPGAGFFYNTPAYSKLQGVLEAASGRPVAEITEAWLAAPLGLKDTGWRQRPPAFGNAGNPVALTTTPRDLSRIGQMVLDGGLAPDGSRVISTQALSALFRPTSTNPAYGRLWWLNGGAWNIASSGVRRDGVFVSAAPDDLIAGLGAQNRQLFVVPSRGLVIVRTGAAAPDTDFTPQLWAKLAKAMPE